MQGYGYQCDWCKQITFNGGVSNSLTITDSHIVPSDWILVKDALPPGTGGEGLTYPLPLTFCTYECLHYWVSDKLGYTHD